MPAHHHHELLDALPDPLALVSRSGETLEANRAFRDLAERCAVAGTLEALFGLEIRPHFLQALEAGLSRVSLPLIAGAEPRPWFRVTISSDVRQDALAVLLADVSEEIMLRRREQERDREIQTLREIGAALSGSLEVDDITERVCEQVGRLIGTSNFYMALYDLQAGVVSFPRYLEDGEWRDETSRPFSNGLTEYVLTTRTPLLLNRDVLQQARKLGVEPLGQPAYAWLGVPMLADGETLGVLATQNTVRSDCYDRHDIEVLSIIAGQAAAAFKNANLLASARRAYRELSDAQARLLESERNRGITEAVGAMNHEVNNPLAAIVGNAQLLLRKKGGLGPETAVKIESILEGARRIQSVTEKMSTLIHAASRSYPGETTIIDLKRSVSEGETCLFPPPTRRGGQ